MTRRIVITGGDTGLGLACAHRLLTDEVSMVLVGRRGEVLERARGQLLSGHEGADAAVAASGAAAGGEDESSGAAEGAEGETSGAEIHTAVADLTDPDAVQGLADELCGGPSIDVLVLNAGGNAGVGAGEDLHAVARAWREDFEGNVLTAVLLERALRGHLSRPGARVVAMSSIAGLRGSGSYGGAKAALNAWVWSTATALAAEGITVNAVAPGFVPETDFWQPRLEADPSLWESRVAPIPAGRPGTAEEVAEAVAYLASPTAGWTTGQILQVNGGTLLGRG